MSSTPPLSPELTREVLNYLGVGAAPPTLALLDELMDAYTRAVPWESAFRIAKRARTARTEDCPRWPEEFWRDAIEDGGGGTCFESNYAFFSLLRALGFEGYLTINNMGESVACHAAIVVELDGESWLVDAGFPVHIPLPIHIEEITRRASPLMSYTVRPLNNGCYDLIRSPHPSPYCYTLINTPIPDDDYRRATTADYGQTGLFLDRVIVMKVVDGQIRRFNSAELPPHIQVFENGSRSDYEITIDVAGAVGRQFGMDVETVRAALAAIDKSR